MKVKVRRWLQIIETYELEVATIKEALAEAEARPVFMDALLDGITIEDPVTGKVLAEEALG